MSGLARRVPIVCLEGPSAVGKTTLAARLAAECGAAVVPELSGADAAPPIPRSADWFADRHAERWLEARRLAATGVPFVVLDTDPLKGLWYNPTFAEAGWPDVPTVARGYRARLLAGRLGVPDRYVALTATVEQLRARRAGDPTRSRRGFEGNLGLVDTLQRWFAELAAAAPGLVTVLATDDRDALVPAVAAAARTPAPPPDPLALLAHMARWAERNLSPRG